MWMSDDRTQSTDIGTRQGLPDALRILIDSYPRDIWQSHGNFDGMTRFWLSRHLEFRRGLALLQSEAETAIDRNRDPDTARNRLRHISHFFIEALHGHHQIEDHHYFPLLIAAEPRLARGFDILDRDHHALTEHLDTLQRLTQSMARTDTTPDFGALLAILTPFETFLNRHLVDEEELIVPIILEHGPVHG